MTIDRAKIQSDIDRMKQRIASMEAELAKAPVGRWRPNNGGRYYRTSATGAVSVLYWGDDPIDETLAAMGNVYRTQAEAQQSADEQRTRVRILDRIAELNGGQVPGVDDPTAFYVSPYSLRDDRAPEACSGYSGQCMHASKYLHNVDAVQTLISEFSREELRTVYW